MKILDLSLTYHWYDEIASGRKMEEYRQIKPFYNKRLMDCSCKGMGGPACSCRHYDAIRFHRGQGSPVTMLIKCLGISIGFGNESWGAPIDEEVYIIRLGEIILSGDEKNFAPK